MQLKVYDSSFGVVVRIVNFTPSQNLSRKMSDPYIRSPHFSIVSILCLYNLFIYHLLLSHANLGYKKNAPAVFLSMQVIRGD